MVAAKLATAVTLTEARMAPKPVADDIPIYADPAKINAVMQAVEESNWNPKAVVAATNAWLNALPIAKEFLAKPEENSLKVKSAVDGTVLCELRTTTPEEGQRMIAVSEHVTRAIRDEFSNEDLSELMQIEGEIFVANKVLFSITSPLQMGKSRSDANSASTKEAQWLTDMPASQDILEAIAPRISINPRDNMCHTTFYRPYAQTVLVTPWNYEGALKIAGSAPAKQNSSATIDKGSSQTPLFSIGNRQVAADAFVVFEKRGAEKAAKIARVIARLQNEGILPEGATALDLGKAFSQVVIGRQNNVVADAANVFAVTGETFAEQLRQERNKPDLNTVLEAGGNGVEIKTKAKLTDAEKAKASYEATRTKGIEANTVQRCSATHNIFEEAGISEAGVESYKKHVRENLIDNAETAIDHAMSPKATLGVTVDDAAYRNMLWLREIAERNGAEIVKSTERRDVLRTHAPENENDPIPAEKLVHDYLKGGDRIHQEKFPKGKNYIVPLVIDWTNVMRHENGELKVALLKEILSREIFGYSINIFRGFNNLQEMIDVANYIPQKLTAGVDGTSEEVQEVRNKTNFGSVKVGPGSDPSWRSAHGGDGGAGGDRNGDENHLRDNFTRSYVVWGPAKDLTASIDEAIRIGGKHLKVDPYTAAKLEELGYQVSVQTVARPFTLHARPAPEAFIGAGI